MNESTNAMIGGIQNLLTKMRERNDDLSIAEVTIFMRSGLLIKNITSVNKVGGQLIVRSHEQSYWRCHHIEPEEIAGYSHINFN